MTLSAPAVRTFTNPLLNYGPDPSALYHEGWYYYLHSTNQDVTIWRTRDLADLRHAERRTVWKAPRRGENARSIWSPELHRFADGWYIYFSADDDRGANNQRMWVLECRDADPFGGHWTLKDRLRTPDDRWAIDGTAFEHGGQLYFVWSGWVGAQNKEQSLYLCRMVNPWTCVGERVIIARPTLPWERHNYDPNAQNPRNHIYVIEGPALLSRGEHLFMTYSASGCWTDYYCIGLLTLAPGADPMNPDSWVKHPEPLFQTSVENGVYGPGHNCFVKDADGADWMLYHANPGPNRGCENDRTPRLQTVQWQPDGTPFLGTPAAEGQPLPRPAVAT